MDDFRVEDSISVMGADNQERAYIPEALMIKIREVREATLEEVFGPPIPNKAQELQQLSESVLAGVDFEKCFLEGDRKKEAVFVKIIDPDQILRVILRSYYPHLRYDTSVSPSRAVVVDGLEWNTEIRADLFTRLAHPNRSGEWALEQEVNPIWLESGKNGESDGRLPEVNMGSVMVNGQRVDPQEVFVASVQAQIGREKTRDILLKLASGDYDIGPDPRRDFEKAKTAVINSLIFGTDEGPPQLFPSLNLVPYIGLTRVLRERDEPIVDLLISIFKSQYPPPQKDQAWENFRTLYGQLKRNLPLVLPSQ